MKRLLFPLFLLAALPLTAQTPGRINIDLSALAAKASSVNDVTLDGAVLRIGLAFLNSSDSGLSDKDVQALSKLQGIYIKNYQFSNRGGGAPPLDDNVLAPIVAQLKGPGWTRIVSAHSSSSHHGHHGDSDDETDQIYVCTGPGGVIQGLTVLSRQSDELDVVNIVGTIDPAELAQLGGHLGIPKIDMPPPVKHEN